MTWQFDGANIHIFNIEVLCSGIISYLSLYGYIFTCEAHNNLFNMKDICVAGLIFLKLGQQVTSSLIAAVVKQRDLLQEKSFTF